MPQMQPQYDQTPLYHPYWKASLAIGSFAELMDGTPVQLLGKDKDSESGDGSILTDDPTIILRSFAVEDAGQPSMHHKMVTELPHQPLLKKKMSNLQSLAWVFTPEQLDLGINQLGDGVTNIYCWDTESFFFPFPDNSPEYPFEQTSLSLSVFRDLQRICDAADRILNRAAESQGTWCSARSLPFTIQKTTMNHIKSRTGMSDSFRVKHRLSRKRTKSGLETQLFVMGEEWDLYRFETNDQLQKLLEVFGPTILMGNRARRPKVERPNTPVYGGFINVVAGTEDGGESVQQATFQRFTDKQGVDMAFNGSDFRLTIRYQRYEVQELLKNNFLLSEPLRQTYLRQLVRRDGEDRVKRTATVKIHGLGYIERSEDVGCILLFCAMDDLLPKIIALPKNLEERVNNDILPLCRLYHGK